MILDALQVDRATFEQQTGWAIKPEGACKDARCVPLGQAGQGDRFDVRLLAERLNMPLVRDASSGLWSLGPEAGGCALSSVNAPEFLLPDLSGAEFRLSELRGRKVLLVAWASW
jgi:hypothetical protein